MNQVLDKVLEENPEPLRQLLEGKEKVMGFFVGKIMRELKGAASPEAVNQALREEIRKRTE